MTRWLNDSEQHVWRQWLALASALPAVLGQQLQQECGISLPDYEIFVALSEAPEPAVRISALADIVGWERSRLSHHLTRMEKRGLVARRECSEDGRGAYVTLTPEGRSRLEAAAPVHVAGVRSAFFDRLGGDDIAALDRITTAILAGLDAEPAAS